MENTTICGFAQEMKKFDILRSLSSLRCPVLSIRGALSSLRAMGNCIEVIA
jgi:hypothetical protein